LILFQVAIILVSADDKKLKLWYRQPANAAISDDPNGWVNETEWLKAFPLGNGSLGIMVYGDVNKERIQLNEKSLWSGSPDDNDNPEAYAALDKIRQLLWEGKYKEAGDLTQKTQVCRELVQVMEVVRKLLTVVFKRWEIYGSILVKKHLIRITDVNWI